MKKETSLLVASLAYAILLLICWHPDLPYGYFQFIRVAGMIVFALLAYDSYERGNIPFTIIFVLSVLIIQPLIKIPLGRLYWNIADTIWAILLIINGLIILKTKPQQIEQPDIETIETKRIDALAKIRAIKARMAEKIKDEEEDEANLKKQ